MDDMDKQSALVALTERQIRVMIIIIQRNLPGAPGLRETAEKALQQLRIALYALTGGGGD